MYQVASYALAFIKRENLLDRKWTYDVQKQTFDGHPLNVLSEIFDKCISKIFINMYNKNIYFSDSLCFVFIIQKTF